MGDEFTEEELKALGEPEEPEEPETPEKPKEPETPETPEKPEEPKEPEVPEENLVPQSRVDEIVSERKEVQSKLELLKTNPDEFYRRYPDEKPKEEGPYMSGVPKDGKDIDVGNLVVDGGKYDGKTVDEVLAIDPVEGHKLIAAYYREQDKAISDAKATEERHLAEAETEINEFSNNIASELFKKKIGDLDEKEIAQVNEVINATLDFMNKTRRGGGIIADAYYLMNRDNAAARARSDGAKAIVDKITKSAVASTSSSKDAGIETGYAADMALTPDQLADKIDAMSDAKAMKYLKEAPKEMRDKYPHLPWD